MTAAFYDDPNFLYGNTSRKYDEVPATYDANRLHWRFEVCWLDKYAYWSDAQGQTEAIRADDCYWNRGRPTLVATDGEGIAMFAPGRMAITLSNHDGRYDSYNASSPLYPNVIPGKFLRLGVRMASSTTYTWRFTGMIDNIKAFVNDQGEKLVEITAVDGWALLQDATVFLPNVNGANDITNMARVLVEADWPQMWGTDLSTGEVLPFCWVGGVDARRALHDIAAVYNKVMHLQGDGKIKVRSRSTAYTSVADIEQSHILRDVPVNLPWDSVWNYIKVHAIQQAEVNNFGSLWGDILSVEDFTVGIAAAVGYISNGTITPEYSIAAGAELEISGNYDTPQNFTLNEKFLVGDDAIAGVQLAPVQVFYTFGTATNGGGTDVSGLVKVVLFRDGGSGFQLVLRNDHSATVYSRTLSVFGNLKYRVATGSSSFPSDFSEGAPQKQVNIRSPYLIVSSPITPAVLRDLATDIANHIRGTNLLPTITLEAKPTLQFMDILDRFHLFIDSLDVANDYRAGWIEEKWLAPTAQAVQTIVRTEPYFVA